MASTEKVTKYVTIKWTICGFLELIFTTSEIILFSKYDLEFLTQSFVILDIICSIVKSLASFIFVTTFHKRVSAYSIPIITGIVTHGVMFPILFYYTIYSMVTVGLNRDQMAIIWSKFIWFVYEIFFTYYLLKYWDKIQNSKSASIKLEKKNRTKRSSSKSDPKSKNEAKKVPQLDEVNLGPEEEQKRRYIQNQLYMQKCLQQNAKMSNPKLSINYSTQRNVLGLSIDGSEVYRARSKSIQSKGGTSNSIDQSVVDEDRVSKKQKQLQFSELFDPHKSNTKDESGKNIETNIQTNIESQDDSLDESDDSSNTSIVKKRFFF